MSRNNNNSKSKQRAANRKAHLANMQEIEKLAQEIEKTSVKSPKSQPPLKQQPAQKKADLLKIARVEMAEKKFFVDFSDEVEEQVKKLKGAADVSGVKDLRKLLWFSIDNDDTKDIDQITYMETHAKGYKVYVGIADVTCLVKKDDPIDLHAKNNTTSVYTPIKNFLMLPEQLSTGFTSLNQQEDRLAMVTEMVISTSGELVEYDIYEAAVRNTVQLAYNSVSAWLDGTDNFPAKGENIPGLKENIRLHDQVAQKIKQHRLSQGALVFHTNKIQIVMDGDIPIRIEKVGKNNRAQEIIENVMIMSNMATTKFLFDHNFPVIRRVVKSPERWNRIVDLAKEYNFPLPSEANAIELQKFLLERLTKEPLRFPDLSISVIKLMGRGLYIVEDPKVGGVEGHFALAIQDYSHTTAPNRRYSDVVVQRLLKAVLHNQPNPYSSDDLEQIAANCTEKEKSADKVERRVVKSAVAWLLIKEVGREYDALVVGNVAEKGMFVRLLDPPIEGKLIKALQDTLDVGSLLRVKLASVNIKAGWIDFVQVPRPQQTNPKGKNVIYRPKSGQQSLNQVNAKN